MIGLFKELWRIFNFSIVRAFKILPSTIDILKYVMFYFLSQTSFSLNISSTFCVNGVQDNKVLPSELIRLLIFFQSRDRLHREGETARSLYLTDCISLYGSLNSKVCWIEIFLLYLNSAKWLKILLNPLGCKAESSKKSYLNVKFLWNCQNGFYLKLKKDPIILRNPPERNFTRPLLVKNCAPDRFNNRF